MEQFKQHIKDLISKGKTKKAIQEFLNHAREHDQDLHTELIAI
mgnify:FL=1